MQPSSGTASHITAFKGRNVLLYSSSQSKEGELVAASSFTLPMRIQSARADRVEVMTIYGPRWVARADIVLSGHATTATAPH